MNIILTLGVILIFVSWVKQKKLPPYSGFLAVFIIMGLQDGVEGDFMSYKEGYESLSKGYFDLIRTSEDEPLWYLLNAISSSVFPFSLFVLILAGVECFILYHSGRKIGSKEYGWLGPILFYFTFFLMLIQMKALRQGLAVELMVLAFYLVDKKRGILWSLILTVAAFFVHNSTLVVLPLLALCIYFVVSKKELDNENGRTRDDYGFLFPVAMTAAFIFIYRVKPPDLGLWLNAAVSLGSGGDMRLTDYLIKEDDYSFDTSWLIVMYNAVIVFLSSWFYQRTSLRYKIFAIAAIIGCYGEMLFFGLTTLQRMFVYFYVFNIYSFPKIVEYTKIKYGKKAALVLIVFLIGYAVKTSLPWMLGVDDGRFGTYRFIFMQ